MAKADGKDVLDREHVEKMLYSGRGLPGGGQLEIRIEISADHPDPDIRGVARRVKFFNLESWHSEWIQVAEKNVELAADFEREERKVAAHEFYLLGGRRRAGVVQRVGQRRGGGPLGARLGARLGESRPHGTPVQHHPPRGRRPPWGAPGRCTGVMAGLEGIAARESRGTIALAPTWFPVAR